MLYFMTPTYLEKGWNLVGKDRLTPVPRELVLLVIQQSAEDSLLAQPVSLSRVLALSY